MGKYIIGTKVVIADDLRKIKWGGNLKNKIGIIEKLEPFLVKNDDGTVEKWSDDYPILKIGRIRIGGIECWWSPLADVQPFIDKGTAVVKKGRIKFLEKP